MKIKYLACALLILVCAEANAQDAWKVDSVQVVFHISNAGLDVEGTVAGVDADIKFQKIKLNKSTFTATANSGTIHTGIKLRDKHLKKADYFDSEKYPTITITSKQIAKSKEGFESLSAITIKGVTKDIAIPFTFSQANNRAEFKGSFSLNRLDFGLGEKSIILSETVKIEIWIGATLVTN